MADQNAGALKCKFCGKPMKDKEIVCRGCGYNTQTNTQDPNFKPNTKASEASSSGENGKGKLMGILKFVILVALIFGLVTYLAKKKNLPVPAASKPAAGSPAKPQAQNVKPQAPKQANNQSPVKSILPNVFKEPVPEDKRKTALILEGVFYDPKGKSFATMSGQVVEEGQNLNGIEIIKINTDSVEISVRGTRKELRVSQSIPFP